MHRDPLGSINLSDRRSADSELAVESLQRGSAFSSTLQLEVVDRFRLKGPELIIEPRGIVNLEASAIS